MTTTYTFTTDDASLATKAFVLFGGATTAPAVVAVAAVNPVVTPAPVAAPIPAAAPAPVPVAAAPAPVAAPVAAAPAPVAAPVAAPAPAAMKQHGEPLPGWTLQHVMSAMAALGQNAALGGPAKVKEILTKYGATKLTDIDPAVWHLAYADIQATGAV